VLPQAAPPATPSPSPHTGHNQGVPRVCSARHRRFRPGCVYARRHPRRQSTLQNAPVA
jgi:hypothetical protein